MIALTRGGLQTGRHPDFFFGDDNPRSDAGLGLQKSAEAIVPEASRRGREGLNVRSSFFFGPGWSVTLTAANPATGGYPPEDSLEDEDMEGALSAQPAPTVKRER